MKNNTIKEVGVAYHYVAHYRKAVFNLLCQDRGNNLRYSILADENSNIPSIKVLTSDPESSGEDLARRWITLDNLWLSNNILWQRGIISVAMGSRFDVLILLGNIYFLSTWVAVVLARLRGKKVYFWTHGFRDEEKGVKGKLRLFFYRLADGLLLYGNYARDILIKKGYPDERIHVIYNSLDYSDQTTRLRNVSNEDKTEKRQELGLGIGDKVIIASGRITREKRFDLLIDAIAQLNAGHKDIYKLIVIGDGSELEAVQQRAVQLSVAENIVFYGACYDESELAVLISMSDVFVVPGDIGLSGIHSLTYGTPVITHNDFATHKPEFEAIVDGVNGAFYEKGNVADMVNKIQYWVCQDRSKTFDACRSIIQEKYTPANQVSVIDRAVMDGL